HFASRRCKPRCFEAPMPTIYTIGFTQKPAARFFDLLRDAGVRRLLDIRLNPGGQLAGFAKQGDLAYFLRELIACDYRHVPALAPTAAILGDYRADHDWNRYVTRFEALMDERNVPHILDRAELAATPSCLLCSEATPERCHRRLVAERIGGAWPEFEIVHLV
ncbi:MAG TPA: DUF488 domain-containing protein, partial [Thermomicrobiales bacterium]|nr:DUF488 domain-containing protein [Thermomicrobiales bacterium]